jgi:hypothetical protein
MSCRNSVINIANLSRAAAAMALRRTSTFEENRSRSRPRTDPGAQHINQPAIRKSLLETAALDAAQQRAADGTTSGSLHQEALEAFSVVAALVLGFSVSSCVAVAAELTDQMLQGNPTVVAFCVMMSASAALSGYSAVFFTMEIYYVKRLSDEGGAATSFRVEVFRTHLGFRRKIARNATVFALAIDLVAIGVLLSGFLPLPYAIATLTLLSLGALLVLLTMTQMRRLTAHCLSIGDDELSLDEDVDATAHASPPAKPTPSSQHADAIGCSSPATEGPRRLVPLVRGLGGAGQANGLDAEASMPLPTGRRSVRRSVDSVHRCSEVSCVRRGVDMEVTDAVQRARNAAALRRRAVHMSGRIAPMHVPSPR